MPTENKKERSFLKNYLIDTAAGTVSGLGTAIITHPLDTVTVRQQAGGEGSLPLPKNFPDAKKFAKNLYSGIVPRAVKVTAAGAIGYPLFTGTKSLIEDSFEKKAALLRAHRNGPAGLTKEAAPFVAPITNFIRGLTGVGK